MTSQLMKKETQIYERLVEACIRKEWFGACLYQSVLLKELFDKHNIKSKVIQGWLQMDDIFQTWHCWVETTNGRYDISQAVIYELQPSTKLMNIEYSTEKSPELGTMESSIQDTNNESWRCYCNSPSQLWDKSISLIKDEAQKKDFKRMRTFRTKVLRTY